MDGFEPRPGRDDARLAIERLDAAQAAWVVATHDLVVLVFDAADAASRTQAAALSRAWTARGGSEAWIAIAAGAATATPGEPRTDGVDAAHLVVAREMDPGAKVQAIAAIAFCFLGASIICLSPKETLGFLALSGRRVLATWRGDPGLSPAQATQAASQAAAEIFAFPGSTPLVC